jgi:uncharacterized protein YyaL (SSP411 family)
MPAPLRFRSGDDRNEGKEGKFFVWTPGEIHEVLGSNADAFMAAYGVTRHGNFEGRNIPEFVGDMDQRPALAEARRKLFEALREAHPPRSRRKGPHFLERPDAGRFRGGSASARQGRLPPRG